jgi:hypothetical protein
MGNRGAAVTLVEWQISQLRLLAKSRTNSRMNFIQLDSKKAQAA